MAQRADVVIVEFPFTDTGERKVRPALVVQADSQNRRLLKTIVVMITGNLKRANEPRHVLIDPKSPSGASSKLHGQSLVSCINIFTLDQASIIRTVGRLSDELMQAVNQALIESLGLDEETRKIPNL